METTIEIEKPSNKRSNATLISKGVLIKWGADLPPDDTVGRQKFRAHARNWAKRQRAKKSERVETRSSWKRVRAGDYSVYDLPGSGMVARTLAKVEEDVADICDEFDLKYTKLVETNNETEYGHCRRRGDRVTIGLTVRQKADHRKLRKYKAVLRVMLHELAHVKYMNHGRRFQRLEKNLKDAAKERGLL